ncbi:MAG: hypothetical protein JW709_00325, partial [Sedimentisphaerales bacterium]|nr:hypothetical protein [Sedimentisphaerales bacterium]
MRPNDKTEKIIKDFDIDVNADRDRDILLELQRVQAESGGANPGYSVIGVGRIFSKSIMAKMVVAAVTIAMLFCLYTATGPFFVSDAFADMRKAMAVMPIMHRNLYTTDK